MLGAGVPSGFSPSLLQTIVHLCQGNLTRSPILRFVSFIMVLYLSIEGGKEDPSRAGEGHVCSVLSQIVIIAINSMETWDRELNQQCLAEIWQLQAGQTSQGTWKTNNFWKRKQWKFLVRPQWWQNHQCCSHYLYCQDLPSHSHSDCFPVPARVKHSLWSLSSDWSNITMLGLLVPSSCTIWGIFWGHFWSILMAS